MPDAHAPMRNFLCFFGGEIPDILSRIDAVSSSGLSNIGCLLLTSASHFSYCLSSCFISRDLFDSFYNVYSFWQDTSYFYFSGDNPVIVCTSATSSSSTSRSIKTNFCWGGSSLVYLRISSFNCLLDRDISILSSEGIFTEPEKQIHYPEENDVTNASGHSRCCK